MNTNEKWIEESGKVHAALKGFFKEECEEWIAELDKRIDKTRQSIEEGETSLTERLKGVLACGIDTRQCILTMKEHMDILIDGVFKDYLKKMSVPESPKDKRKVGKGRIISSCKKYEILGKVEK